MEFQSHAVAADIPYHLVAIGRRMVTHCLTHIPQKAPGLYFLKTQFHAFLDDLDQLQVFL